MIIAVAVVTMAAAALVTAAVVVTTVAPPPPLMAFLISPLICWIEVIKHILGQESKLKNAFH